MPAWRLAGVVPRCAPRPSPKPARSTRSKQPSGKWKRSARGARVEIENLLPEADESEEIAALDEACRVEVAKLQAPLGRCSRSHSPIRGFLSCNDAWTNRYSIAWPHTRRLR